MQELKERRRAKTLSRLKRYWPIYALMLPAALHFLVFRYLPMAGLVISFKNYRLTRGIFQSAWCGLYNFQRLFTGSNFTYIYKVSFMQGQHAMGAAAGLFKSFIGLAFVLTTNAISKRFDQEVI